MLYVSVQAQENGARANMMCTEPLDQLPTGWIAIPAALEEEACRYLPYLDWEADESGAITAVREAPHAEPEPEEEPVDEITQLQLALAELAAMITAE